MVFSYDIFGWFLLVSQLQVLQELLLKFVPFLLSLFEVLHYLLVVLSLSNQRLSQTIILIGQGLKGVDQGCYFIPLLLVPLLVLLHLPAFVFWDWVLPYNLTKFLLMLAGNHHGLLNEYLRILRPQVKRNQEYYVQKVQ